MKAARRWLLAALLALPGLCGAEPPAIPSGDVVLRGKAGPSEVVITTTSRVAGAIHSLTWNGKEFIDSFDHGRQLQSAINLDCGKELRAETYNPTEAGSRHDGHGPASSSKLLKLRTSGDELETTTQMAFWLRPGERSGRSPAYNEKALSDFLLTKKVKIGYKGMPGVLDYRVTFTVPKGEYHTAAVFETVTGYMPPEFGSFWKYDFAAGKLVTLDDGPGEQSSPVVLSTESGSHAMGVYSPDQPSRGFEKAGYGRFRFRAEKVVKWNCVFRKADRKGLEAGDHSFRCFVLVGTRGGVEKGIAALRREVKRPCHAPSPPSPLSHQGGEGEPELLSPLPPLRVGEGLGVGGAGAGG